jgi:hypothetical protein
MPALFLAALTALAGPTAPPPSTLEVAYTVSYDLPAMADRLCAMSGMCDCTVTYVGKGALVEHKGDRLTFEGTWTEAEGTCDDGFKTWVPADGKAFHTLRLSEDGAEVTEWIAHADRAATDRVTTDIKANGQVWLAGMHAALTGGAATHSEQETGQASSLQITTAHTLKLLLAGAEG